MAHPLFLSPSKMVGVFLVQLINTPESKLLHGGLDVKEKYPKKGIQETFKRKANFSLNPILKSFLLRFKK
jgi:hypothetical protein